MACHIIERTIPDKPRRYSSNVFNLSQLDVAAFVAIGITYPPKKGNWSEFYILTTPCFSSVPL